MLLINNYITDTGKRLFLLPVSFFSSVDDIDYQYAVDNNLIPIEILDHNMNVTDMSICKSNVKARRLEMVTPDNIDISFNVAIPFREIDLQMFVNGGYKVSTIGEKITNA